MTDDDALIARLREAALRAHEEGEYRVHEVCHNAADRIAALKQSEANAREHIAVLSIFIGRSEAAISAEVERCAIWEERAARMQRERDANANDAERIDYLEAIIRDGSYLSIINDIVAMCHVSYANFGKGPALRTAIDAQRLLGLPHEEAATKAAIDAALKDKP